MWEWKVIEKAIQFAINIKSMFPFHVFYELSTEHCIIYRNEILSTGIQ